MSFPQGIAFRATVGFVTDGANDSFEDGSSAYPRTTAQGNNVGTDGAGGLNIRDRNSGNDPRIAGVAFYVSSQMTYRIDLPSAGDYNIRIACGDDAAVQVSCEVFDNTTSKGLIVNGTTGANNEYLDATNVNRTAAAWPGSNAPVTKTFASTIAKFTFASLTHNAVSYLYAESAVVPTAVLTGTALA